MKKGGKKQVKGNYVEKRGHIEINGEQRNMKKKWVRKKT